MLIGRRNLLIAPFAAPFLAPFLEAAALSEPRRMFAFDHVLGTSMELTVQGKHASDASRAALAEIARVSAVVSTYDPNSEISRWRGTGACSTELAQLLAAYRCWEERSGGVISRHSREGRLNVDALGKAFVLEKALRAARRHCGSALLNIGGDLAASGGQPWPVGVADPARPYENAAPLATIALGDMAIATSGGYERGAHIHDGRTGRAADPRVSATVLARDMVAANALATALCVLDTRAGLSLVAATPGAECLILRSGETARSPGFMSYERPGIIQPTAESDWTPGWDLTISLTLKPPAASFARRPYVAVWAEDEQRRVVRNLAVWASRPRWLRELHSWFADNSARNDLASMTRATRPPGLYRLTWDGLDDKFRPVPAGTYTILIESNREHGNYAKESAKIQCGTARQARASVPETSEFEAATLEYGPRTQTA